MTVPKFITIPAAAYAQEVDSSLLDNEERETRTPADQDHDDTPPTVRTATSRWQADASMNSQDGQQIPFRRMDTPPKSPMRRRNSRQAVTLVRALPRR